jgi:hypothetical protein
VNGRSALFGYGVGRGNATSANAPPKAAAESVVVIGEEAVKQSKAERKQKDAIALSEDADATPAMKRAASKTFYLRDGAWNDADFKPEAKLPETTVTFGSEAYFELLKQKPKLAEYFALGERIVVVFEGRVYRVNAATP